MPWNPAKPAGSDPANTIDNSCGGNFAALEIWANAFTTGVALGSSTILRMFRAANDWVLRLRSAAGDTADRFRQDLQGRMEWGDGANPPDIGLSRAAANVLRLDAGDQIRVQQDPTHEDDLTRKAYVDSLAASGVFARSTSPVDVVNTTAETTIWTVSIPGGTLGTNKALRLSQIMRVTVSGNVSPIMTVRLKYGGVVAAAPAIQLLNWNIAFPVHVTLFLMGRGSTSAQAGQGTFALEGSSLGWSGAPIRLGISGNHAMSVDSTVDQDLVLTYQMSVSDAWTRMTFYSGILERL